MYIMKKVLVFILAVFAVTSSYSQTEIDVFRSSRNDLQGTARVQGMGGAFGALGGDLGAVVINPAGLAVFRSSEVSATLAYSNFKITTNNDESQNRSKFNFDNISYVGYLPLGSKTMNNINFGFTYNRLKNFDRNYTGYNQNRTNSLTDFMAYVSEGFFEYELTGNPFHGDAPWLSILGWNTGLIKPYKDSPSSYESFLAGGELVASEIKSSERGYIEAYDFSVGTNFSDKVYFGLTFSLTDFYYQLSSTYWEDFEKGGGMALDNYLETTGSGYQLKLGAIFRPLDQLRLGIAYHSPTWYSMTDIYDAGAFYIENGVDLERKETPNDAYTNYKMQTPYSWTFSAAAVLGANAIVSVDYEIKDYTTMNLKDKGGYNIERENQIIDEDFKIASNLRLGLEYKFTSQFSGRLGYSWMGSPYTDDFKTGNVEAQTSGTIPQYTVEGTVNHYTAGLGYRFTPQFYVDLAFVYRNQKDDLYYFPSMLDPEWNRHSEPVAYKNNTYRGLLTFGYKF